MIMLFLLVFASVDVVTVVVDMAATVCSVARTNSISLMENEA